MQEYGPAGLDWACGNCPKRRESDLHPYTVKLLTLRALQRGGYPFSADDLSLEEWVDLGNLARALEPGPSCPLAARGAQSC